MPVKNAGQYLEECLQSIINQTELNWELIAVNDHSSDNTEAILSQFAELDNRISFLDNDGNGIIDALKLAYSKSKGELITRMDADDIMMPQKLEVLKSNLLKLGEGYLATGLVKYFSDGILGDGYRYYQDWLNGMTLMGDNYMEIYKECVIPSPCWMLYREDFEACGGFNRDTYPEDYDLVFRFYESRLKVIPCDKVLHQWRDYANRSSRTSEHYADNTFLQLKCHYFLKLDHDKSRPLIIWGAGKKAKEVIKNFKSNGIQLNWMCNNPNKIGKKIYNLLILEDKDFSQYKNPQIIVTIANRDQQNGIKKRLQDQHLKPLEDYFFFC